MSDNTPKWHGWATPDQCREMITEMQQWLKKIDKKSYKYPFYEVGYKFKDGKFVWYETPDADI